MTVADPGGLRRGQLALLEAVTEACRHVFDAGACSVAVVDDGGDALFYAAASGRGAAGIVGVRLPLGSGIAGWVATSGQPVEVADATADPRHATDVAEQAGYVPRALVTVPLLDDDGDTIGVLQVLDRGAAARSDDLSTVALFARIAALALPDRDVLESGAAPLALSARERAGAQRMLETLLDAVRD